MIDIAGFIEKKKISGTQAKEHRARPITEADREKESENSKSDPMDIEPMTGPRMHPGEAVILKEETRLEPQPGKITMRKILTAVPDEEAAKSDAEENDRGNINRRKSACPKTGQDFLKRDHCGNDRYMSGLPESKHISTGFQAWVVSCPKLGHYPGLTLMAGTLKA